MYQSVVKGKYYNACRRTAQNGHYQSSDRQPSNSTSGRPYEELVRIERNYQRLLRDDDHDDADRNYEYVNSQDMFLPCTFSTTDDIGPPPTQAAPQPPPFLVQSHRTPSSLCSQLPILAKAESLVYVGPSFVNTDVRPVAGALSMHPSNSQPAMSQIEQLSIDDTPSLVTSPHMSLPAQHMETPSLINAPPSWQHTMSSNQSNATFRSTHVTDSHSQNSISVTDESALNAENISCSTDSS